jgi:hypothetical protein
MERKEKCTIFWLKSQNEKDHSEDRGVDGRMGSEWILGRLALGVEWVQLAQNRGRWKAVADAVMKLRVLAPRN